MNKDTSKEYDHLIGYVSQEKPIKNSIKKFIGFENEFKEKPEVKEVKRDKQFPEDWQKLIIKFNDFESYVLFMKKLGYNPSLKLNSVVYKLDEEKHGIEKFLL